MFLYLIKNKVNFCCLIPQNNFYKENRTNVFSFKEKITVKLQFATGIVTFFKKEMI